LCRKNNIHYDIVYPEIDSKQDYISRMKKRGNNIEFINNMQENFEKYCFACANDEFADEKIKLKKGEFLEDVIKKLKILNKSPLLDNYMNDNNLITKGKIEYRKINIRKLKYYIFNKPKMCYNDTMHY